MLIPSSCPTPRLASTRGAVLIPSVLRLRVSCATLVVGEQFFPRANASEVTLAVHICVL